MKPIDSKEVARLTQQLDALQQQRLEYMAGLTPISEGIRKTEFLLAAAISPFEVNEAVIWLDGRTERRAIIGQIRYSYGKPEYYVYVRRKDGTPGVRLMRVWHTYRNDGQQVLRPDPGATPASDSVPAATVGASGVVQNLGGSGLCS